MSTATLHLSAYAFVALDGLAALRERIEASAAAAGLKGTVLLAHEGINLFVAGPPAAARAWLGGLRADPRLAGLRAHVHESAHESAGEGPPLRRLVVKIKPEIVRMNTPAVRPEQARAPAVAPEALARWLARGSDDAGRPLALLDTRNGFEVDAGAFECALDWRLRRFGDFPAALAAHRGDLEGKAVVAYCTGGIRCEKAVLLMRDVGLEAHQLDGGILGYFAATGDAPHWRGRCFVFDGRAGLVPPGGGPVPAARGSAAG